LNALGLHQKEKETLALLSEENVRKNLAKPWISNRQLSVGSGTVLTIPTETRIKSVHGSPHFFTCGLFVLIIVISLKHQEVKFINTDASGDQNLKERASSTTKEPNQQR